MSDEFSGQGALPPGARGNAGSTSRRASAADGLNADEATAARYGIEFIASVADDMFDPSLVSKVPVEWSRTNGLLPVRIRGELCVLTDDPGNLAGQEYLALLLGSNLRPILAPRHVVADCIERCYYRQDHSPANFLNEMRTEPRENDPVRMSADDLLKVATEAPVTQLVNLILIEALKRRASDIHFEPFESSLRVRYRIDGMLYEQMCPPRTIEDALVSRLKVMARMDIAEKRLPQDGMARVKVGDREIDIRASTVPVAEGERVVLRLLDRDSSLLPLSRLGMSDETRTAFEDALGQSSGIILVSGPTGSGKTTTLYAALRRLDATRRNIMTIEDPIEYQIPDIGQIQVKPKIGLTFASGLRHVLRQDPDVILVGETRDLETAEIAMRASLTGHLVFTTLHTNDAPTAVLRLADMGVEPYLVSECLRAVLAQRLVRRLCPECRVEIPLDEASAARAGDAARGMIGDRVWGPRGCPACLEGYRGRTGVFELMLVTEELRNQIRAGDMSADSLRRAAERAGMSSLLRDGMEKARAGVTSLAEILNSTRR